MVTSSVYATNLQGLSIDGGVSFNFAKKNMLKLEHSEDATHNIAASSLSVTLIVCKVLPHGVCVAKDVPPSGMPLSLIAFIIAAKACAEQ